MKYNDVILKKLLSSPVVLDVETTTSNDGNPFDLKNKLVLIQIKNKQKSIYFTKENFHDCLPYLEKASLLVGQNIKFDLHWMRRELGFIPKSPIWELQNAEFLFSKQQWKYPDLDTMCKNYGVGEKIHTIEENYWSKGIDTDEIPIVELAEYGVHDVELTWKVFQEQIKRFQNDINNKFPLFRLLCNDLLVLQEMEWNGIIYDEINSLIKAKDIEQNILILEDKINSLVDSDVLNYNSGDDISILLYGGTKIKEIRFPIGFYKTGVKTGQPRYKIIKDTIEFPRRVTPLKGSELSKEGFFATNIPVLLSLKTTGKTKKIIDLLLERSALEKINGTYLKGFPKTREKYNWPVNKLHSSLNQCVASTGRLSSTKPNQQNLADLAKSFCITRY
jgi:DNA polymerase I-like protein with 3'-5' exonuclease and polymerase domains